MTLKASVFIVIASFALLACGQTSSIAAADECNPNQCTIKVKVANNCSSANDITVDIPTMKVPKANKQIRMDWNIETDGFGFAKEPGGITFTAQPQPPQDEFHDPNAHGNDDRKYKLVNANSDTPDGLPKDFKYNIQLLRVADGTKCPLKDPVIRNGS